MSKKVIEINGIPSGDYEGFCWAVTKEEFIRLTGKRPNKYDKSYFHKRRYMIYPNIIYENSKECKTTITVEVTIDE